MPDSIPDTARLLDHDPETGLSLYDLPILYDRISVIVEPDGTALFNDDWQSRQPQTLEEALGGGWRWVEPRAIDF